ncbi:MAG: serine--tRNA ligase, partial [Ilumatobacteraceae bacterium]
MIDVRLLRSDPDAVVAAIARRADGAVDAQLVEARRLDEQLRAITAERDGLRARINELSKEVGRLRREGDVPAADALQGESRQLGADE